MAAKDDNDSPETENPAGEGGEVKPLDDEGGFGLKKILLILIPVLLIGVGAGLYFTGTLDGLLGKKPAVTAEGGEHAEGEEGEHAEEEEEAGAEGGGEHGEGGKADKFFAIPDLLVNLNSTTGAARFLRLKVKIELKSAKDLPKIEAIAPRVVDQFQTFLREMRLQDLRGSAGIYRLRQELLYRVNIAAYPIKVKDVLFQEILIQ